MEMSEAISTQDQYLDNKKNIMIKRLQDRVGVLTGQLTEAQVDIETLQQYARSLEQKIKDYEAKESEPKEEKPKAQKKKKQVPEA